MTAIRIAAVFGLLAVALGALGAHGLEKTLVQNGRVDEWKTASLYHVVHAVVMLVVALQLANTGGVAMSPPFWLFGLGIVFFSGSLYYLCLTNAKWVWPITPLGGLCFLAGWLYIIIRGGVR
ncbi:MAG TPA: DUF423 domain-containing protein [Chthoniobacteraceae bacterium]|nr:DUF423 domain-containing protein [Chthoniobacteraceae bacterium]